MIQTSQDRVTRRRPGLGLLSADTSNGPVRSGMSMRIVPTMTHVARASPIRLAVRGVIVSGAIAVCACAPLPPNADRAASFAIPATADTPLGALAKALSQDDQLSGFRLLPAPDAALDARNELIKRAQQSLDIQYYDLTDDTSGRRLLQLVREAAARGVRVRLLIDDLHTSGQDARLIDLAQQPNIEVRVFNPFPAGRDHETTKILASLLDSARIERRMHNKLLIADGAFAIAGGRNIADEYFRRSPVTTFVDLDVLVTGALLEPLSSIFDRYWNSQPAYPIATIATGGASSRSVQPSASEFMREDESPQSELPERDSLDHRPLSVEMPSGTLDLVWAQGEAIADAPEKAFGARGFESVRQHVRHLAAQARQELTAVTPYLVPGAAGMETFEQACKKGVRVTLATNSLASTDVPVAFAGYARYRSAMLRSGIHLYEVAPARVAQTRRFRVPGSSTPRLHAKAAAIDRRIVIVGSVNVDPRSEDENTELVVVVDSEELARQLLAMIDYLLQTAYQVALTPDGQLQWLDPLDRSHVLATEPETNSIQRMLLQLYELFVPESLL